MKTKSVASINPCKSVIQPSYDIVKAHGGQLKVETNEGEGLPAGASARAGSLLFNCPLSETMTSLFILFLSKNSITFK